MDGRTYPALAGCCLPGRHGPAVPMSMPGPPMTTSTVVPSGTTVSAGGTCSTTSPYSSEEQTFHPILPNRNPAAASSRRAAAWPPPSLPRPRRFGTDVWSARLPTAYPAKNTPNKRTMATTPTSDRRIMWRESTRTRRGSTYRAGRLGITRREGRPSGLGERRGRRRGSSRDETRRRG